MGDGHDLVGLLTRELREKYGMSEELKYPED